MVTKTNEQALESAIEKALTGTCLEELKDQVSEPALVAELNQKKPRFTIGYAEDFDAKYALDTRYFWNFLETTQKEELEKLQKSSDWQLKVLDRFDRMVKKYGVLRLLRKGLDVEDAHFTLLYQLPLSNSSASVKRNFALNQFSVTRQVRYNQENLREEIDMAIFLNGIPLATLELKNHWTGQNAKVHGVRQYKSNRNQRQPLLNFGRCLVHFAVDTDEVYMTTKLCDQKTFFLPFNKGHNHGKGNPPNPKGHKSAYLWNEVFTPKSLAGIIQHFVRFDGKASDSLASRTLFFPRYHQMNVVRKILAHARNNGVGHTYLIQHSAGSGKSNSITWAAYQLIETYPKTADLPGAKDVRSPLFDSVIVVTDRRLLDKQLRDNIREFSEVKNIVAPAMTSSELKTHLEGGKRIIITTIQKFPFIIDGIADLSNKRFAVIIDEAHSSQSGSAASTMNQAMGASQEEESDDPEVLILKAMEARKMRGNASYLAFTATPKNSTLERFGERKQDGSYEPFHLYSMKQAIEEGFILDVLANYTTYKSYYEIEKSVAENPEFDTVKAQKKLRAYVERDERTIGTKAEIMLEHFITQVVNKKKLKGKAKGMVVTQNIESAIRYYKAISKLVDKRGNPFKVAIAFSGKKKVDGVEYTEPDLNGFGEKDTRHKFDEDAYRLLVVANKYLTGFDQPKLSAMYVDKKLQGVLAVQALSRLNRSAPSLGKRTEDLFILDFFNTTDDIKSSFDPFYSSTKLSEATDINVLHELKATLDDVGVYEGYEVEDFVTKYFADADAEDLSPIIDVAADRFNNDLDLEDEDKADFKIKAKQFVKIYGQVSSIMDFSMVSWEKLFWFLKFLIPKLVVVDREAEAIDDLLDSVDLSTYGLERTNLNASIGLDDSASELAPQNANPRGAFGGESEADELEEIVRTFNERWFQGWDATPEDQRVKFVALSQQVKNHPDFETKVANNTNTPTRDMAFKKILEEVMSKQRKQELELYKLYAKDDAFKYAFFDTIKRMIDEPDLVRSKVR
ncbi:type I restriction endonuclease subunit R [Granulosicoccus sp. 3-233]|uniref:type I restriction endonuclease subunit R n=1 Tax=Granulosicoccus sp. 3-233 TaxID=3417969 RepID=UPI003D3262CA